MIMHGVRAVETVITSHVGNRQRENKSRGGLTLPILDAGRFFKQKFWEKVHLVYRLITMHPI